MVGGRGLNRPRPISYGIAKSLGSLPSVVLSSLVIGTIYRVLSASVHDIKSHRWYSVGR